MKFSLWGIKKKQPLYVFQRLLSTICYVVQASFKLMFLKLQPSRCWNYRCIQSLPAHKFLRIMLNLQTSFKCVPFLNALVWVWNILHRLGLQLMGAVWKEKTGHWKQTIGIYSPSVPSDSWLWMQCHSGPYHLQLWGKRNPSSLKLFLVRYFGYSSEKSN